MNRGFTLGLTLTSLLTLAGSLQAQATPPYVRTIIVSPVPGNTLASGDQLRNAVASINPSPGSRWTIQLEPGVFDLGRNYLQLKPWMSIVGAGSNLSVIRGNGQEIIDRSRGVVQGATQAELRHLKIDCVSAGTDTGCIAMANLNASPRLKDVQILAKGGNTSHWGMRNSGSSPVLDEVEILASGGLQNYGIVNAQGPLQAESATIIRRSSIRAVNGSGENVAVLNREGSTSELIEDTEMEAWGGTLSAGVRATSFNASGQEMTLRRVTMDVSGATATFGVVDGAYQSITVVDSEINVAGASSVGVAPDILTFAITDLHIRESRIDASNILVRGDDVLVVQSWLDGGGLVTGVKLQCSAVIDDAQLFLPAGCP